MRPLTAADLMNPQVLAVEPEMTVAELASFLVSNEITGAPVVDREGRLVGVVSVVDLAKAASGEVSLGSHRAHPHFLVRGAEPRLGRRELPRLGLGEGLTVGDIMTPEVHTVADDTPVAEIARLMLDRHLHRLLVTAGEEVVGIVSTSDLLGLLIEVEDA